MILTLTGNNAHVLQTELKKVVADFVAEQGDLALEKFDAAEGLELHQLLDAVQSMPFLASKKMVLVRDLGSQKILAEQIESIVAAVSDSTDLVLYESKLDKRTAYAKFLQKKTTYKNFEELQEQQLLDWLIREVQERNGTISRPDVNFLVQRVGTNQLLLAHELDKLLLFGTHITRDSIEQLTEPTPQSTVFALLEAAFSGNAKHAVTLYSDQREQKVEPQAILAMIIWQLHIFAVVAAVGHRPLDTAAKEAGISPYVAKKSQNIARRLGTATIKKLIHQLLEIDVLLKTKPIDPDEALQNFLVNLAAI